MHILYILNISSSSKDLENPLLQIKVEKLGLRSKLEVCTTIVSDFG